MEVWSEDIKILIPNMNAFDAVSLFIAVRLQNGMAYNGRHYV